MHYINRGYDNNDNHNHKGRIEIEVAEKVRDPDPSLPEALLVLVRSGSGQVCGFDYLLPTTYDLLPTTDYRLPTTGKALLGRRALSCQEQRRLNACRKEHAYNAYREEHLSERSICPLTMLVERSMLTMRIERSICPRGASFRLECCCHRTDPDCTLPWASLPRLLRLHWSLGQNCSCNLQILI